MRKEESHKSKRLSLNILFYSQQHTRIFPVIAAENKFAFKTESWFLKDRYCPLWRVFLTWGLLTELKSQWLRSSQRISSQQEQMNLVNLQINASTFFLILAVCAHYFHQPWLIVWLQMHLKTTWKFSAAYFSMQNSRLCTTQV